MKSAFIKLLLFFWGVHFLFPLLVFWVYPEYAAFGVEILYKAFWMNTASVFGTIFLFKFLPDCKRKILPRYNDLKVLYYGISIYTVFSFFALGGFTAVFTGKAEGAIMNYISVFLDISVVFIMLLGYQKKPYSILTVVAVFTFLKTVLGSRSGVISVIYFTLIIFPMFANFEIHKRLLYRLVFVLAVISPLIFYFGSTVRGIEIDQAILTHLIVNRMSLLENATLPVACKDGIEPLGYNEEIFYRKYHPLRQLAQFIPGRRILSIVFGDLFTGDIWGIDVHPNQYFRTAFMGVSEEFARTNYTSINTTLPSYFYMYMNEYLACVVTILVLTAYYLLWLKFRNNQFLFISFIVTLYSFLYCFDFVMWFTQFYGTMLTILNVRVLLFIGRTVSRVLAIFSLGRAVACRPGHG